MYKICENVLHLSKNSPDLLILFLFLSVCIMQSQSSLEMALSHSFEVKTHPIFQLISGCVQRALGHVPEALASLQAALKMSRAQPSQSPRGVVGVTGGGRAGLGLSERVTVYLEMVDVLTKLGRKVRSVAFSAET